MFCVYYFVWHCNNCSVQCHFCLLFICIADMPVTTYACISLFVIPSLKLLSYCYQMLNIHFCLCSVLLLSVFFIRCSISAVYGALFSMPFHLHVLLKCLNICVDNVKKMLSLPLPSPPLTSLPSFTTSALLSSIYNYSRAALQSCWLTDHVV